MAVAADVDFVEHQERIQQVAGIGPELVPHDAGGAADPHRRHRRDDAHVIVLGDLAGDEAERAFDEGEHRAIVRAVRLERIFVERHARIGDEVEHGAVGEGDAGRRIAAGRDDVALEHRVADMERDGNAVAHHGNVADDLLDLADRIGRSGRLRLRILARRGRAREQIDDVGRKAGAVRRYQRGMLLARKISGNDVMAAVMAGEHEVGPGAMIIAAKQQVGVRDADVFRVR